MRFKRLVLGAILETERNKVIEMIAPPMSTCICYINCIETLPLQQQLITVITNFIYLNIIEIISNYTSVIASTMQVIEIVPHVCFVVDIVKVKFKLGAEMLDRITLIC